MKFLYAFIFLAVANLSFGQNGKIYKGTINNTINITLYLQDFDEGTYADPIVGSYKYDAKKEYILLNGFRNIDEDLCLVEFSNVNFSGTFLGTITKNKIIGKWISSDQKKNFDFELTKINPTKKQLAEFENAITDKANQFRNY